MRVSWVLVLIAVYLVQTVWCGDFPYERLDTTFDEINQGKAWLSNDPFYDISGPSWRDYNITNGRY